MKTKTFQSKFLNFGSFNIVACATVPLKSPLKIFYFTKLSILFHEDVKYDYNAEYVVIPDVCNAAALPIEVAVSMFDKLY